MKELALLPQLAITAAVGATAGAEFRLPGDAQHLTVEALFTYGSGGTNATAYVQTSLDSGVTWIDIMAFQFTTATAKKISKVSRHIAVAAGATPTDGSMAANTILDGVIGRLVRVKYVTTGTYGGTTHLTVKGVAG